jgi:hypothetical protein
MLTSLSQFQAQGQHILKTLLGIETQIRLKLAISAGSAAET